MSKETNTPSCFTPIQNSEKSKGHTLKYQSSEPVTQKPADTEIEQIALSWHLYKPFNSFVLKSTIYILPYFEPINILFI